MNFTPNQEKAITLKDREILVSAAAGSGKTSVLVERIIRKITNKDNPVDIDRMLIMTFTSPAAKEMKDRIREAIEKLLDKDPHNDILLRQSGLIHNAQISTIHGFCQSVINNHFEEISIDPNFRVADTNEIKLISADVLDDVLESLYEEGSDKFLNTVECFAVSKNDKTFADMIMKLYSFAQSNPEPDKFLEECLAPYSAKSLEDFKELSFVRDYVDSYKKRLEGDYISCKRAIEIINDYVELSNYKDAFTSDLEKMENALNCTEYDDFRMRVIGIDYDGLGRVSVKDDEDVLKAKNIVSGIRDAYKKDIDKNIKAGFVCSLEDAFLFMQKCRDNVECLVETVKRFSAAFAEKKREKNIIDFNDMEHMAIAILMNNPAIAQDYRESFAEIYVDEYQDSNMTQEVLVNLIKKDGNCKNVFMVGDVKQSIYRFRQARPDLFAGKYDSFTDYDSDNQRVLLNDNFRSRKEVIEAVNEIFKTIMKKEVGNVEYDDNAKLIFGADYYPENEDRAINRAEIIIGVGTELPRVEFEATIVANRINQMIEEKVPVYDKKTGTMRPLKYSDIVILSRSAKGWHENIKSVLENSGIPVSMNGSEGYFGTTEVRTVLSFLSAVDNPFQDIPTAAVMASPIGGFTNREMAVIRNTDDCTYLYEAVVKYSENEGDIACKCRQFVEKIQYYKQKSVYVPVYGLLKELIDSDYGDYVRGMDRGNQRMANLNMLMAKAIDYGKTSFKGLFNFVRYMDLIQKYEIEDGEANILGDEDDVVRIMTIHKSKGLEFPICFVVGIDKKRNEKDETGPVIWDAKYGIGVDAVDIEKRTRMQTIFKNVIKNQIVSESIAEEIRVLYVAMTRAREKLIMVGWNKDEKIFSKKKSGVLFCNTYMDMIFMALDENNELCNFDVSLIDGKDLVITKVAEELYTHNYKNIIRDIINNSQNDNDYEIPAHLKDLLKNDEEDKCLIPAKLSVSELKHQAIEEKLENGEDLIPEGQVLFKDTDPETYIPAFMRKEGENLHGGTFYGTAFHRILELWGYEKECVTADDIRVFADEMLKGYRMNREQVDAINSDDIAFFLNSELGRRMYKACKAGKLRREQPFVIGVEAKEIVENAADEEETVLIQGIIDAYIEEEEGITIIDYKTDYVTEEEMLVNRYKAQLDYYAKALKQLTGCEVNELLIYSSRLRRTINVV